MDYISSIFVNSWIVLGQMAPYLLLGFLVAGFLSVFIRPEIVERHLGGHGILPVIKAAMFGVPLPLCSCGVIPVSASLRRHGASRGATASFLISTPQTGVDSIAVTYALLGPIFAVIRPVLAFITGIVGGILVDTTTSDSEAETNDKSDNTAKASSCDGSSCGCKGKDKHHENAITRVFHYGFVTLPGDIGPALLLGVIVAGAITSLVPQGALGEYVGGGIVSILVMMAVGIPVYVCSTASVSVVFGFLHLGVSPGAALAFLIAGPATNAATITTIWKVLGKRTAIIYLLVIALSAICGGMLLDWLLPDIASSLALSGDHVHDHMEMSPMDHIWAMVLLGVTIPSYFAKYLRSSEHGVGEKEAIENKDQKVILHIDGMHCSHCSESVCRALLEQDNVDEAEVLLKEKRAIVFGKNLNPDSLVKIVTELGYVAKAEM